MQNTTYIYARYELSSAISIAAKHGNDTIGAVITIKAAA